MKSGVTREEDKVLGGNLIHLKEIATSLMLLAMTILCYFLIKSSALFSNAFIIFFCASIITGPTKFVIILDFSSNSNVNSTSVFSPSCVRFHLVSKCLNGPVWDSAWIYALSELSSYVTLDL